MKFNVGDRVIGNKLANVYNFTKEGYIGTVIRAFEIDGKEYITLGENDYASIGTWMVQSQCFDLIEPNEDTKKFENEFCNLISGEWQ